MAFAGWVGLLITSLNLMPIGQLDGGHVLYALLRQKANRIATLLLYSAVVVVALDFKQLYVWMLMLVLLIIMGPVHPPTADDSEPLGRRPHCARLADARLHHHRLHAHAFAGLAVVVGYALA